MRAPIPRLRWDDPLVDEFLRRGEPCILTGGCPLVSSLLGRWDFEYLSRQFGDTQLSVHFVRRGVTRFARHYGSGLGEGGVQPMSFAGFLRTISDEGLLDALGSSAHHKDARIPGLWRYYLQAPLLWCACCRMLQLARGAGPFIIVTRLPLQPRELFPLLHHVSTPTCYTMWSNIGQSHEDLC